MEVLLRNVVLCVILVYASFHSLSLSLPDFYYFSPMANDFVRIIRPFPLRFPLFFRDFTANSTGAYDSRRVPDKKISD